VPPPAQAVASRPHPRTMMLGSRGAGKLTDTMHRRESVIVVEAGPVELEGILAVPRTPRGAVLFAHGRASSRDSPRNRRVAVVLAEAGFATLLLDLLTAEEQQADFPTRVRRYEIPLLGDRLAGATDWVARHPATRSLPIGYFGASAGAGVALVAAAARPEAVAAIVSRGGRPDLAGDALARVRAPTLLILGGLDAGLLGLNEAASASMRVEARLEIVPGATHLFGEPGALDKVTQLTQAWFERHVPWA
jgi:putative phosphoribosyl transferase